MSRPPVREFLRPAKVENAVRRRYFRRRLATVPVEKALPVRYLGTFYGGWSMPVQLVRPNWVVYCVGAGNDVSLETELIRATGCEVFSFDPSPVPSSTTLSAANLDVGRSTVEVPCRSLHSLMSELGHDRIDLLKYHVEGSEYEIFDPRILFELRVKVLGIRLFHTASPRRALELIGAIESAGYALVAHDGSAFTFVRREMFEPRIPRRHARRLRTVVRRGRGAPVRRSVGVR
jgi:FkbM family methyltransferase